MKRKLLVMTICTLMFSFLLSFSTFAKEFDVDKNVYISGGSFGINETSTSKEVQDTLKFDYSWITTRSNYEYNKDLAKVGVLLATNQYSDCLVGGESISGKGSDEVASLNADSTITLSLFGLSDVQYFKFSEASMNGLDLNDVTGVTMGYKLVQIGDEYFNVFFAIPDSTEGEAEWLSNFDVGCDNSDYYEITGEHPDWIHKYNHKGFDVAANRCKTLIGSYIESKENGSYPTSIFLCGHSRGGAVSNILGTLLIDEGKYKVYDYTFGTPNTVEVTNVMTKSKIESYKEIFNHVNNDDFVTVLPCEAWGFTRYGNTLRSNMHEIDEAVSKYNTLLSSDNFYSCPRMEDDPEDTSPEGLMTIITSLGDDRESFYRKQVKTAKYFKTDDRDYDYDSLASQLMLTLGYANVFSDYYKIEKVGDDTLTTSFYYSMTFRLLAWLMANRDDDYFSLAYKMLGFGLILSTDEFNENIMKSYDVLNKDYYEETLTLLGYIAGNSAVIGRPHYVAGYLAGLDYRDPKYFKYNYKDLVTYTGKEIEPDLEIFDLNKKLEEGEDFSLSFEDNIEPGTAKMKVNFIYSPSGMSLTKTEIELPFTIAIQTGGSSKKNINLTGSSVAASSKNSIKESDSNSKGTVILKSSKASKGQTVKAEIVPKDGYKASGVIITDKNGKQIETKLNDDNSFEFKMPSSNVNIEVIYEELPKSDEDIRIEEILDGIKKDDIILADSKEGEKITSEISFIRGYEDGSFKADNKVTNIEFMCMVTSLFKNLEDNGESINLNQGDNYWGEDVIKKANFLGLIPGDKENRNYNLNSEITRADMAQVIYNIIKDYSETKEDVSILSDIEGKPYEKAARKLISLGIIKGYDDNSFHGDNILTRAEAVTIINRTLKSLGIKSNIKSLSNSFNDLNKTHWAYNEIMYAANAFN